MAEDKIGDLLNVTEAVHGNDGTFMMHAIIQGVPKKTEFQKFSDFQILLLFLGHLNNSGPLGPYWVPSAILGPLGHFGPFWAFWAILGHFGPFWALWAILGPLE